MTDKTPAPGVSRKARLCATGLERLERQLDSGVNISAQVLAQWIRRYGESARRIIKKHNKYQADFDRIR